MGRAGRPFYAQVEKTQEKPAAAQRIGILAQKASPAKPQVLGYGGVTGQKDRAARPDAHPGSPGLLRARVFGSSADRAGGVSDVGARRALGGPADQRRAAARARSGGDLRREGAAASVAPRDRKPEGARVRWRVAVLDRQERLGDAALLLAARGQARPGRYRDRSARCA